MKELSIEEKAKAYDLALDKAKEWKSGLAGDGNLDNCINELFPQLNISDDEKIRKYLINQYKGDGCLCGNNFRISYEDIRAWLEKQGEHANFRNKIQIGDKVTRNKDGVLVNLSQLNRVAKKDEKQGEQKPAWSEEDENKFKIVINALVEDYEATQELINWFKSLKDRVQPQPKQEWSEEDAKLREATIGLLNLISPIDAKSWGKSRLDCIEWLKFLHPQSHWKPSEEQITWLYRAADDASKDSRMKQILNELLSDLKKLMGE